MKYALRFLNVFRSDARGVAAVEFACIVPLVLFMFIGVLEASRALAVNRRFDLATSMVADLVGREDAVTANDVKAMYNIVAQVMSPFDASRLKMALIPVMAVDKNPGNTKVYAATANRPSFNGAPQPAKCSAYPLDAGLIAKGTTGNAKTVIVVKSTYDYTPALIGYLWGSSTWTEEAIVSPRNNSCVHFDGTDCDPKKTTCF